MVLGCGLGMVVVLVVGHVPKTSGKPHKNLNFLGRVVVLGCGLGMVVVTFPKPQKNLTKTSRKCEETYEVDQNLQKP